ncbi:hypothetical protein V7S43_012990 [Phytophthora oleae]|uniref:non-specific serine/threonine protein kinase n=1 Tax=Phytophthora oleae TaxID=2107226 RepID=A0ABD3F758_9STRA
MMENANLPTKTRDEYNQLAHIGRGTYGDVFLCERVATGEQVCQKEMDLTFQSSEERKRCLNEVALLQLLPSHPNIVKLHDAFWAESHEESQQVLVLSLEHADGGDLGQYLRSSAIQEGKAREIFTQLAQGVDHLHRHRVIHRDLKCGNIFLFRSGRVVLGDFGTSKQFPPTSGSQKLGTEHLTSTVVGSPLYMSPEMLEGELHGFATDIWSLGCLLYEMLAGKPAFGAPSYPAVVFRVIQGEYEPLNAAVSSEAVELIARMLRKDPENRPSIVEVLQSTWLRPLHHLKDEKKEPGIDCSAVVQPIESLPPAPVERKVNKQTEVSAPKQTFFSPPPAPVKRMTTAPIRREVRSQKHCKEIGQLWRVGSPLIRLDVQPPPPAVLPSRKHLSIPSTRLQRQGIPAQPVLNFEVRGVHITGTTRCQTSAPLSTPKP